MNAPQQRRKASLVLAGGVGLGAFQAGAFEVLAARPDLEICSVSGASIGALNGAIIAGNAPDERVAKLQAFWKAASVEAFPARWFDPWRLTDGGTLRRARNWSNVLTTSILGSPALFHLRGLFGGDGEARSIYNNRKVRRTLEAFIDFPRINDGAVRFCCAATDIEVGEAVFFDTAKGDIIGPEHLIASSSLVPAFEPIRIGNRLLADGGLAANLPLEAEIGPNRDAPAEPVCFAFDLFTPEGSRPGHLNRAVERAIDMFFGMQTRMRLAAFEREWAMRAKLASLEEPRALDTGGASGGTDLIYASYRGAEHDAGFGKPFDLSPQTLKDRWREGAQAGERALAVYDGLSPGKGPNLCVHRV